MTESLQEHMFQHIGMAIDAPVIDGHWHTGQGKFDKVSYVGQHLEKGLLVRYRHWGIGEDCYTWKEWQGRDIHFNPTEYHRLKQAAQVKADAAQQQAEQEQQRLLNILELVVNEAKRASIIHPYIERKHIFPIGALEASKRYQIKPQMADSAEQYIPEGELLIPVYGHTGALMGVHQITRKGQKLARGTFKGGWHWIGGGLTTGETPNRIYIAEGYATAVSVHMRTRNPVVVAFNTANLQPVGERIRQLYPDAQIIYAADNDIGRFIQVSGARIENPGRHYAEKAARVIGAGVVISPMDVKSDWNDWHIAEIETQKKARTETTEPDFLNCVEGNTLS